MPPAGTRAAAPGAVPPVSTDDAGARQAAYRERERVRAARNREARRQVPPDWVKACDACDQEQRARWLQAWRARAVLVRPEAAHEVPGHCQPGALALRNWYPPDSPRHGCRHPRLRADGELDYRGVPRHLRPPGA
jgi:hypothetical protein